MEDVGDVIVVGAGPVGFLTALGLARKGIRVTLVEAERGINNSPRAAIYFPTTCEIIDKLGLLEDAEEIGLPSPRYRHHPLLTDAQGRRLAKRDHALTVRATRRGGLTPGRILPALEAFAPDIVFISAGFDAHRADPLAELCLEESDYAWATSEICSLARRVCRGRVVSSLEGGYDLAALARSAAAHVRARMEA